MGVLIIEDETLIRMFVRDLLEEAGFDCVEAADAAEALGVLEERNGWTPAILVTDLNLGPGLDGIALAAEAQRRLSGLTIVYATGNADRFAGRLLGRHERVIPKPFAPADLIAAVRELALFNGAPSGGAMVEIGLSERLIEAAA